MLALYALQIFGKLASTLSVYVIKLFMLACRIQQAYLQERLNVAVLFDVEAV